MLKDWMPRPAGEQNEQKARLKRSREELAALQMNLKENKLPVLVLVEGWGAAGKGSLIRSLIKELDPRFFQVVNMGRPTPEEQRYPFLKRYVQTIPEEGKIVACLYDKDKTTLKRFHRVSADEVHLIPENVKYQPIVIKGNDLKKLQIQGVATMVMKKL